MPELKYIITADDSQYRKTLDNVSKAADNNAKRLSKQVNEALRREDSNRGKVIEKVKQQQRSILSLQLQMQSYQGIVQKATDPQILVEYNRKVEELQKEITRLSNAGKKGFDDMGNAIKKNEGLLGSFKTRIGAIGSALGIAFGVHQLISFGRELFNIQKSAQGVELAFARIGDPTALDRLRTAVRGTVSDLELMKVAVRADNFKIPMDVLAKGLEFARQRAADTGQEVDYLVNSFVDGLGRKSTLVLDNLGISASELQEEVNKVGDFAEAVGNIIGRMGDESGIAIDLLADKTNRWAATWDNIKRAASDVFSSLFLNATPDDMVISQIVEREQKTLEGFDQWNEKRQKEEIERRKERVKELAAQFKELEAAQREFELDRMGNASQAGNQAQHNEFIKRRNEILETYYAEQSVVKDLTATFNQLEVQRRQEQGLFTPEELRSKIRELQTAFDNTYDPAQLKALTAEMERYEAILDRITGKEKTRGQSENDKLRVSLLEKLNDLQDEYARKSMSANEAEVQAVRDKFKKLANDIAKFNEDPNNKIKIDTSELDNLRDRAISDIIYRQETEALKLELAEQKKLYDEFDQWRDKAGEASARKRYENLINIDRTYLENVQEEIAKLEDRGDLSAVEKDRLSALKDIADNEIRLEREKQDRLLISLLSYREKMKALEEKYHRDVEALGENATEEQLEMLQRRFDESAEQLRKSFRQVGDAAIGRINDDEELKRGLAEVAKYRIDRETELQRRLLKIAIEAARKRIEVLKREQREGADLGINNEEEIKKEETFIQNAENHLERLKDNYIIIGEALGNILSQSSDEFVAKIGNMIQQVSNALGQIQSSDSSLGKAQGIVGLITAVGTEMKKVRLEWEDREINALRDISREVANRINLETQLNKVYFERRRMESENPILGRDFQKTMNDSIAELTTSASLLENTMTDIFDNAIISAEGKAKRMLGGTKKKTHGFSLKDVLAAFIGDWSGGESDLTQFEQILGKILDPLNIFGGETDQKVKENAFLSAVTAVKNGLDAMGKSIEDFPSMSAEEMLDFFTVLQESGNITDEGTKQLIASAKEQIAMIEEAREAIKGVITDIAGGLGNDLMRSMVNAFAAGEDAAQAFGNSVSDIIKGLVSQMLFSQLFKSDLDKLVAEMESSYGVGGDQSFVDDIIRFNESASKKIPAFTEGLEALDNMLQGSGLTGFDRGTDQPQGALAGAIRGITADQADLLAGQFGGMRLAQLEALELAKVQNSTLAMHSEYMTQQLGYLNSIAVNTEATAANTARLESIDRSLKNMDRKLGTTSNQMEAAGA